MKVEDNTLSALRDFFFKELLPINGERETQTMFKMACEHYLKMDFRKTLPLDSRVSESEMLLFFGMIKRLKKSEPIQHIIQNCWFYDLQFKVSPAVLIPRPETEELVHWVIRENIVLSKVVDLCAGSGCIPIALKNKYPTASFKGYELSEQALEIARFNSAKLQLPVDFIHQDVLVLTPADLGNDLDVITSNPPYVLESDKAEMEANVLQYEPHMALFAPERDLFVFYRKIGDLAANCLKSGGKVYVEIHPEHGKEVSEIFSNAGLIEIDVKHDISNRPRMVRASRK